MLYPLSYGREKSRNNLPYQRLRPIHRYVRAKGRMLEHQQRLSMEPTSDENFSKPSVSALPKYPILRGGHIREAL